MSYLKKTRKLFPAWKACSVSGYALLLKEEPCPLRLQMVFLSNYVLALKVLFLLLYRNFRCFLNISINFGEEQLGKIKWVYRVLAYIKIIQTGFYINLHKSHFLQLTLCDFLVLLYPHYSLQISYLHL